MTRKKMFRPKSGKHLTLREAATRWRSDAEKRVSGFHYAPEVLSSTVQEAVAVRPSRHSRLNGKVITTDNANCVLPRYSADTPKSALTKVRTASTVASESAPPSPLAAAMHDAHSGFLALNEALLQAHLTAVAEALAVRGLLTPTELRRLTKLNPEEISGFFRAYAVLAETRNVSVFLRCLRSLCLR